MNAIDLIKKDYGVEVTEFENPVIAVIPAAGFGQILPNNPRRLGLLITNLGAAVMYIRMGGIPTAALGIRLDPLGGWFAANLRDDFTLPTRAWFIFGTAGQACPNLSIEIAAGV